jgi:hypothetical protein
VEAEPLRDLVTALSPYGVPFQLWDPARHMVRRNATLPAFARRLARRQPTNEPAAA